MISSGRIPLSFNNSSNPPSTPAETSNRSTASSAPSGYINPAGQTTGANLRKPNLSGSSISHPGTTVEMQQSRVGAAVPAASEVQGLELEDKEVGEETGVLEYEVMRMEGARVFILEII